MFLFVFICENTPKKNHMQNEVSQKLNTDTQNQAYVHDILTTCIFLKIRYTKYIFLRQRYFINAKSCNDIYIFF